MSFADTQTEENPQVLGSALEYKSNCQSVKVTYLAQGWKRDQVGLFLQVETQAPAFC